MDPAATKRVLEKGISQDEKAAALDILAGARRTLTLKSSVIASVLIGLCHVAVTRTVDTFAVTLAGDGNAMLLINPDFAGKLGEEQSAFVLAHEVYHLLLFHLRVDTERQHDPIWVMATEAWINRRVQDHLLAPQPKIDGAVTGVDPDKVYGDYRQRAKKAELDPPAVDREAFFVTDEALYSELCRLPKPPPTKQGQLCIRMADDGSGGEDGDSGGAGVLDKEQLDILVEKVLGAALQEAVNGNKKAGEELLSLMEATPDCKTWGDLGADKLRGQTTRTRKTDLWAQWVMEKVGSRLRDGDVLRYNKKWPYDPRVTPMGPVEMKHGSVFVDASGSMHSNVLEQIAALIGEDDEVEIEWFSFDGTVQAFEPGEPFKGGGGTSFSIIEEHVRDADEDQDFVLVVTDGYAPEIDPSEPDKWIWLIVPGGTTWPSQHGMDCREIDFRDPTA